MNKIKLVVEVDYQRKNTVEFRGKMQLMKHDHEVYVADFDAEKFFCIPFIYSSAAPPAFQTISFSFYFKKRLVFSQTIFWNDLCRHIQQPTLATSLPHTICLGQLHTAFLYDSMHKKTFDTFDETDFENKVFFTVHYDEKEQRLRFNKFYAEFNKNNLYYLNS